MPGEMVSYASNGSRVDGYLALPAGEGRVPGVVVIQEWWGLVPHINDVSDRFAAAGYAALAPDLYHGRSTTEPDEAGKLMMDMQRDVAERELRDAVRYLAAHPRCTGRVGVVGFCMGGGLALLTACTTPEVAACVDFYGVLPGGQPNCDRLQAPVLVVLGDQDPWVPLESARALERDLRASGKVVEVVVYPGAGHAFFNDTGPAHHPEYAADAWRRTLEWFGRYLR
jgi:carboxymethylenebutenolidase